jgi:hypothetical protein
MRGLVGVLLALALAGCAYQGLPLRPAVSVPPDTPVGVQGEARLVVRTFTRDAEGTLLEVGGARCQISSLLFQTDLVTPAPLIVPNFGPQSPTLEFDCRAGELTGQDRQRIVTRWIQQPGAGAWGWGGPWGPWGDPWGGPWGGPWGWPGPAYAVFEYPDVAVLLQ